MGEIIRGEYPELDRVLWDYHTQKISADLAFHMYEERWSFVDKNRLGQNERLLIEKLTAFYGNGLFMAA
ncbi:hypothetical protein H4F46_06165 [Pectobacterium brasiliense]|uniref:hypothetical protein n=1 Tax=Pectobacterium brasiliense TaxID=180957 RepID=UPI0004E7935B|nr:hypothetical protein [Pectobacterium brasiliense]KFF62012.1 hypothetical protein IW00_19010 [Pectobacterium brasiliense]KHT07692.1 hypothetical protein RC91_00205 [Pectobacterium brasiliense]KHT18715.1 hypothetical protein RC97_07265 [Pectobacterium brasiliense]MBN3114484.1 hypothetical protein [Pectobacterium brasiliense]